MTAQGEFGQTEEMFWAECKKVHSYPSYVTQMLSTARPGNIDAEASKILCTSNLNSLMTNSLFKLLGLKVPRDQGFSKIDPQELRFYLAMCLDK